MGCGPSAAGSPSLCCALSHCPRIAIGESATPGTRCGHCQVSYRVRFGSPTTSIHDCLEPSLTQRARAGKQCRRLVGHGAAWRVHRAGCVVGVNRGVFTGDGDAGAHHMARSKTRVYDASGIPRVARKAGAGTTVPRVLHAGWGEGLGRSGAAPVRVCRRCDAVYCVLALVTLCQRDVRDASWRWLRISIF
jgi:hypothetical protein